MRSRPNYGRRRLAAAGAGAAALVVLLAVIVSAGENSDDGRALAERPRPPAQLPGGGRRIFPDRLVVAYYGAPQDRELGELGIGSPASAGRRLLRRARAYAGAGRRVLPAMELIVEIANRDPGPDGLYRTRQPDSVIRRYLAAARRIHALLILDIQPGHAGFFAESRSLERWLREPDVSLALDPEWHTPNAIPGTVIGDVDVREVNAVSFWLADLVARHRLPQKLLLVHRFTENMIAGEDQLKPRRAVAVTVNVDGFGGRAVKIAKYRAFAQHRRGLHNGFKLFYHEDLDLLRPARVLRIRPRPEIVVYE